LPSDASKPSDGVKDIVGIDAGTPQRIAAVIDRIFTTDYCVPFKSPDMTPLSVAVPLLFDEPAPRRVRAAVPGGRRPARVVSVADALIEGAFNNA
jgi:hypothetical protein